MDASMDSALEQMEGTVTIPCGDSCYVKIVRMNKDAEWCIMISNAFLPDLSRLVHTMESVRTTFQYQDGLKVFFAYASDPLNLMWLQKKIARRIRAAYRCEES